jgi:hypothetical protein
MNNDTPQVIPPRQEMAAEAKRKLQAGEKLTQEEQRLLILALPRKVRRKHKIRTTPIRLEIAALKSMGDGVEKRTGYTGNTAQHQQRYDAKKRLEARCKTCGGVGYWHHPDGMQYCTCSVGKRLGALAAEKP